MFRFVFAALFLALLSFPTGSQAMTQGQTQLCLQEKFNYLARGGFEIAQVFNLTYITASAVGPDYRGFTKQKKTEAMTAVALAIRKGVRNNQFMLQGLQVQVRNVTKKGSIHQVTGSLGSHRASANIDNNCRILHVAAGGTSLRDWLRASREVQSLLP